MKNDKFWNECNPKSLRGKIAEFIDSTPVVSHFKDEDYYDLEDALVEFIYNNRNTIYNEVDLEFQREDFLAQAKQDFGNDVEKIVKVIPIEVIDSLIESWQESLSDNHDYWDAYWGELSGVLTSGCLSPLVGIDIDDYQPQDILVYATYLREWYADETHIAQDSLPACIDEFFANEMSDDNASAHYINAAITLFGNKIKEREVRHIWN